MSNHTKAFTLMVIVVLMGSALIPLTNMGQPESVINLVDSPSTVAATTLLVVNNTYNDDQQFNDDDFEFFVYNTTVEQIIDGALVTLYNASDLTFYDDYTTVGTGRAEFVDVPQGVWVWNVTWVLAPDAFTNGTLRSDGPEAFVTTLIGNLDSENDDDDFNATVVDLDGTPADGLNFTIYNQDTNTTDYQVFLGSDGVANFTDIPIGNYTYYVTVVTGTYAGTVIAQDDFVTDGTKKLVHQILGPFSGDADYYDLEVFTYYETTLAPLSGAIVNVTYINGTVIDIATTPANGTIRILDLPVAFINWTVTYLAELLSESFSNLTDVSADIRDPIITTPGDFVEYLFDSESILLNWTFQDEYPLEFKIWVDEYLNDTVSWVNTTQVYTFNATGMALGTYEILVEAVDLNSREAEATIELRIYEDVLPTLESSGDVEYIFTETGNSIRWNVTDDNVNMYSIERDGELIENNTIDSDAPFVVISVDALAIGVYTYTFTANDTSGNEASDNVTVTVLDDTIAPVISYSPPTIYYEQGVQNIVFNWTASDDFMDRYVIEVDGFVIEEGAWTNSIIEFDFSGLGEGTHYVKLTVTDLGGNSVSSTVTVEVSLPTIIQYSLIIVLAVAGLIVTGIIIWYLRYR